jgi:hypothetical protein
MCLEGLEAVKEALTRGSGLEPARGAQTVAGGDVAALDAFGGLTSRPAEPRAHVRCLREDGLHGGDVRLVVVTHDGGRSGGAGARLTA